MISKTAVKEFLNRELESYNWMKSLTEEDVNNAINDLPVKPVFHTKPFLHQKICFLIGIANDNFMFFLDLGTGKSKIILDIFNYRKKLGQVKRCLVLVPYKVSLDSWKSEIAKHAPNLSVCLLEESTEKRKELLRTREDDIFVLNYAGLVHLCSRKVGKKRVIDYDIIRFLSSKFQMVVFDESQALKNHNSWTYKICDCLTNLIQYRYALTGTPFGRDPHDVWPQFHAIDKGETMGSTLGIFREAFFNKKINRFTGYPEWVFDKRKKKIFHRIMQNNSIFYKSSECSSLPDKIDIPIEIKISGDAKQYLFDLLKNRVHAGEKVEGIFVKIRQICSGYISVKDEETGTSNYIEFSSNPRVDALFEIIESMPHSSKIVVFNEFVFSGDIICRELNKRKIGYARLYSGTKDHAKELNRFLNDSDCRVFVVNSQSGAAGLNLQVANYVVFFESPTSPIVRAQAEKRCHRTGQKKTVFMYDLISDIGVDKKILTFLKEGKDLHRALVQGEMKIEDITNV